jgi:hypothetical protein
MIRAKRFFRPYADIHIYGQIECPKNKLFQSPFSAYSPVLSLFIGLFLTVGTACMVLIQIALR